jgi:two-component SAPR family response regulator
MLIYIADDEPLLLDDLYDAVLQAEPSADVKSFDWSKPLLAALAQEKIRPAIVFLDIEMPGMSGMELAEELKRISPQTKIIFVTGFQQYAVEAFSIHADGYLMKPVTADKIHKEMDHLRPQLKAGMSKRLRAQCFGNFEIFIDDEPMHFQYTKTRELLAYLISRNGALCSNGEIMAVLWEDESVEERKKEYFKKLRSDLRNQFESKEIEDILIQQRGFLGISADKINCDYYDWINHKSDIKNAYPMGFMSQYSWAENIFNIPEK